MASRHWTFCGLVGAFLDLTLAYLMLCGAATAFFFSKFLGFAGLHLPSPSPSIFNHPNGHFFQRVSSVMTSLRSNFPFDSLLAEADQSPIQSRSKSVICVDDDDDGDGRWSENSDLCDSGSVTRENRFESRGWGEITNMTRSRLSYSETDESFHSAREHPRSPLSIRDKDEEIKALKKALEQERTSQSILSLELEKERSAAASATDEAMAMILRLQKEKAGIEMEAKQFQRMVEEKSMYDEEEMNILKEIIFRREMEKHVLLKENEMYRQMLQKNEGVCEKRLDKVKLMTPSFEGKSDKNLPETKDDGGVLDWEDHQGDYSGLEKSVSNLIIVSRDQFPAPSMDEAKEIKAESDPNLQKLDWHPAELSKMKYNDGGSDWDDRQDDKSGVWNELPEKRDHERVDDSSDCSSDYGLRRSSMTSVDRQRMILDAEVEFLKERLDFVQKGREKLNFSLDPSDKDNFQLHLLEEITTQLHELRQLTESRKSTLQSSERGKTRPCFAARKRRSQGVPFSIHVRT
ncbi:uncharacterized protein LOC144704148 isoform X2 [Wolffia australiana]